MKIIEQRYLRGANLHADCPCLLALLDLGPAAEPPQAMQGKITGLTRRLLQRLGSAGEQVRAGGPAQPSIELLGRSTHLADVVAALTMALQQLAGNPVTFSRVDAVRARPGHYRIVCAFRAERVAAAALDGAIALMEALAANADFSVVVLMATLRRLTRRAAIGAGMTAVLAAAQRRGIPVMRLDESTRLFQLGWGKQQQRLQATSTGKTGQLALELTSGAHVPRKLLAQAGQPVPKGGAAADAGEAIVATMFGDDDGRIPLVAVTGTNGKTTTTRLIAHTVGLSGLTTGMATTGGVDIGGRQVRQGDCTGYHSARLVLTAPEVEFAVLETARGGILKRGLAFDRCDVGVVLNVTADHLGLDGIETLDELARVKQVVADAARIVVLNADDPVCVAMAAQLRAQVERVYFSLDAGNPVLLRHLEDGGRAVFLQEHMVTLADGAGRTALIDARAAPVTLGGLARHNIANALAATAALAAAGLHHQDIARGLADFVSDGRSNPLRSNVFDVDGIRVVMDFAHNAAAYASLAAMARAMSGGRLVGIVSAPGDRRDGDLQQIGAVCAAGFDDLVIYESENRGRPAGDVARLMTLGARHAGNDTARLYCKIEARQAIRFGLKLCHPGDVLAFGCSSSIDELLDAIRRERPAIAERIQAEVTGEAPGGMH